MNRIQPQPWTAYGVTLDSRLLLGTAGYPSPQVLREAFVSAEKNGVLLYDIMTERFERLCRALKRRHNVWIERIARAGALVAATIALRIQTVANSAILK